MDDYPDILPELSLNAVEGEVDSNEVTELLGELRTVVRYTRFYCGPIEKHLFREKKILEWQ